MDIFQDLRDIDESLGRRGAAALWPIEDNGDGLLWEVVDVLAWGRNDTYDECVLGAGSTPQAAVEAAKSHERVRKEQS